MLLDCFNPLQKSNIFDIFKREITQSSCWKELCFLCTAQPNISTIMHTKLEVIPTSDDKVIFLNPDKQKMLQKWWFKEKNSKSYEQSS